MARVNKLSLTFGCRKNDSAVDRSSIDVTILPESEEDNNRRTDRLEGVYRRLCQDQSGPFLLLNLGKLLESYRSWEDNLKIVRPFYAVKANCDLPTLKILASLGCGFDCASKGEIEAVLSLGVPPSDIIYANPCKDPDHIRYANSVGVNFSVFDGECELRKMADLMESCKLLVRLKIPNPLSDMPMGMKFGVTVEQACHLIDVAQELGLSVCGVCFHIGNCVDYAVYERAIHMSRQVFDYARDTHGINMTVLNLGGGFPGGEDRLERFQGISQVIKESIASTFDDTVGLQVMAEPGRFFATSLCESFMKVISRRTLQENGHKEFLYYLNDGIFGSYLMAVCFLHIKPNFVPLILNFKNKQVTTQEQPDICYKSTIFGPYMAPVDILRNDTVLLPELDVGDWVHCADMGAYTTGGITPFHSFSPPEVKYVVPADKIDQVSSLLDKPFQDTDVDSETVYLNFT
jgi:ornithine decarboxylase